MTTMRRGAWVAAALLAAGMAQAGWAQTAPPPDPLAPGAAAASAQPEKAEKASPEKKAEAKPEHKRRAKRRRRQAAGLTVTVHNERSVGLMQLSVVPAGDPDHKKVLGALAFGRKAEIHLKRAKDCLYDVRGHFADGADTEQLGVELCKDKTINLTD